MNKVFDDITSFFGKFKNSKAAMIVTIILLLLIIGFTAGIRTHNIPNLKDVTTGEYLTADLDAFYFLRLAELLEANGSYSEYDDMRYPLLKLPYSTELLPHALVFMYKFLKPFSDDISLRFVDVIYPVIFFVLSMIVFFFFILKLTKSKFVALFSSFFLAIIPAYLFRTMAGVSDHEPLGMFAFFLVMLAFTFSMETIDKKKSWKLAIPLGVLTGFLTVFNMSAWGGISIFTLLIISLAMFLLWITNANNGKENLKSYLYFYFFWMISFILLGFIFHFPIHSVLAFFPNLKGMITPFIFLFMLLDFLVMKVKYDKIQMLGKYRIVLSLILTGVILIIASLFLNSSFSISISSIFLDILRPFGGGRTGSTVAENALPYTLDIINQIGKSLFWIFFAGILLVGIDFAKGIGKKENKILFSLLWVFMICGIIFHRYSTGSIFNGDSFISKLFYIGSLLAFFGSFIWIYFKDKIEVKSSNVIILLYTFFMALAGISAIRLLFILTPVICFIAIYSLKRVYDYASESKDEIMRVILYTLVIGAGILLIFVSIIYIRTISAQAPQIGSSANVQWQQSMSWVRENTQPGEVFVHWWDYGYWVQYMGERPSVTDGGHGNGYWDHLIGRYLLTTPNPESALSFMKSQNVSYLLIDPSDVGKYAAYSSIGSDASGKDRLSYLHVLLSDQSAIQETKYGIQRAYYGGFRLDGDLIYKDGNNSIFIAEESDSGIAGFIIGKENNTFEQPQAIYVDKSKQINLPMRYLYSNGTLYDFETGINSGLYLTQNVMVSDTNLQLDEEGAVIYFSPKVIDSLISQLYIMNDPKNIYPGVTLVHSEPDPVETYIEMYGLQLNEFFYLNGLRGPLKIWEINPPSEILALPEFTATSGEFASLDNVSYSLNSKGYN